MPKFLEEKLKKKFGSKSKAPFKIMNSIGAMHGNKETSKGHNMQMKHEVQAPVRGLSSNEPKMKKKKMKSETSYDPFAKAMNK